MVRPTAALPANVRSEYLEGARISGIRWDLRSMCAMSMEASLFGDEEPDAPAPDQRPAAPVADWQVDLLRKALDARGLTSMVERQRVIEEAVGHAVTSLRALTGEEAMRTLARLGERAPAKAAGSRWDERDEDTWIDRL